MLATNGSGTVLVPEPPGSGPCHLQLVFAAAHDLKALNVALRSFTGPLIDNLTYRG